MGGAVSSGRDNDELIDNLMGANYIRTRSVEEVFRALDRAEYMTGDSRDQAYKDLAWRNGSLHLSAPCIYSEVMENLELKPGLSFLNVGSGTGYLSTLVGLILGSQGINHGVEVRPSVVAYANKRLTQFLENSPTLDEFDFCEPKFYLGNGLCLAPLATPYDRVYCGAGCPTEYENYFKQLIKVGGILVMPLDDNLVQVKRLGETEWSSRTVFNVSFATLIVPSKEQAADLVRLEEQTPARLQVLARAEIRAAMRAGLRRRHPELRSAPPRAPPAKKACPRRICIPIDDDSDVEGLGALHDLYRETGANEMNALLSFMLSMGHNRVAGALRFDTNDTSSESSGEESLGGNDDDNDDDDNGGGDDGGGGDGGSLGNINLDVTPAENEERAEGEEGSGGRERCPLITLDLRRVLPAADGDAPDSADDAPMSTSSAEPTHSSGEDNTPDKKRERKDSKSSDDDQTPEKKRNGKGESSKKRQDGGESSRKADGRESGVGRAGRRGAGDGRRRRTASSDSVGSAHSDGVDSPPEVPAEVEILLGKSTEPGPSKWSMEWEEGAVLSASSDDERAPRQKLDSGIGEENSPETVTPTKSDESDASHQSDSLSDDVDDVRITGRRRLRRRTASSGVRSPASSAASSPDSDPDGRQLRRNKRRAGSGGDARRARLSVLMKRGVKELPLPHALKKFVNLMRCYEF